MRIMGWPTFRLRGPLLLSLAVLICWSTFAQETPTADRALNGKPTSEVRALWVVRTSLTSVPKIQAMVKAAAENGFNTLIVQVRGRGDAYYKSRREPRAIDLKDQPADFDPLAVT